KARQDHRLAAVFFIELMRPLQMALAEQERILTAIKRLACPPADPIANLVARDCAQGNEEEQFCKAEIAGRRKHARGNQQGIAGQEKSHEESCLNEDNRANQQRAAPFNQALNVKEEMNQMFERSDHE